MDIAKYIPLWAFIALMVGTPGPANLLAMTAAARNGFVATIPFIVGLTGGKLALNIGIALGIGALLVEYPAAKIVLSLASAAYMIFLAIQGWKPPDNSKKDTGSFSFASGLIVHPLNPKAWVMGTLAVSQFATHYDGIERFVLVPLSFFAVQMIFHPLWAAAGAVLRGRMDDSLILNRVLVLLTIAVVLWALLQ